MSIEARPEIPGETDILPLEVQQYCLGSEYRVFDQQFFAERRKLGVSGFMRLRNEAEYLPAVIESHLPYLDELVIVFNRCTDNTPDIVADYARQYPEKIKAYAYPFFVHPQGSNKHVSTSPISVHSLVHYYNFALSRTTYKYVVKVDGDHIAIPKAFARLTNHVKTEQPEVFVKFAGINLVAQNGEIGVWADEPLCGIHGDIGFFPVSKNIRYMHHERYEVLAHALARADGGIAFFHLKQLKSDNGLSNYDLQANPQSPYSGALNLVNTPKRMLSWSEFVKSYNVPSYVPSPQEMGMSV